MAKTEKQGTEQKRSVKKKTSLLDMKQGPATKLTLTHKGLISKVTQLARYVESAQRIVHSTITASEQEDLDNLLADLDTAIRVIAKIRCPNPMYSVITVDKDRLCELDI